MTMDIDRELAFKYLARGTFGPKVSEIETLMGQGLDNWLDDQFNALPSYHRERYRFISDYRGGSNYVNYRINAWWDLILHSHDQLRQRVAFCLSQLLVVSQKDPQLLSNGRAPALATYYDILVDGAFGNFGDLLRNVTKSPVMGEFLTLEGSQVADPEAGTYPDENYSREFLQLFTLGEWKKKSNGDIEIDDHGNRIPAYLESDVQELARILTGWSRRDGWELPMRVRSNRHDSEAKTFLDVEFPANEDASDELDLVIELVLNERSTSVTIAKHLIWQLVTPNPSSSYIQAVSERFYNTRGDLKETLITLFQHSGCLSHSQNTGYKLGEPIIKAATLFRVLDGTMGDKYPHHRDITLGFGYEHSYSPENAAFQQGPLTAPSVFNFFSPEHKPTGPMGDQGMLGPEFEILTPNDLVANGQMLYRKLKQDALYTANKIGEKDNRLYLNLHEFYDLAHDRDALLDHLSLLLIGKETVPRNLKTPLRNAYSTLNIAETPENVYALVWLVSMSSEYNIQG